MDLAHIVAVVVLSIEAAVLLAALAATLGVTIWMAVRVGSPVPLLAAISGTGPAWRLRVVVDQLLILDDRDPLRSRRPPPQPLTKAA